MLEFESAYSEKHTDLAARVFLSVGELETSEMVADKETLVEKLKSRNYLNLELISQVFDNETHLSVIPATMSRGLREIFNHE